MRRDVFLLSAIAIAAAAVVLTAAILHSPTAIGVHAVQPVMAASAEPAPINMTTALFRTIAKNENPVVVAITTESKVKSPRMTSFGGDDFFGRFFGMPMAPPREQVQEALGSGFIISKDGEIVTNNHVIAGADKIRVALLNDERKTYTATVVGRDPLTDTALIKLQNGPGNLPVAVLGDSDALEPGDWVMAIGNPFQLGHTVTVGVVSYIGRPFATTEGRFENMIQTDASINPGNSGGPLINTLGHVVGINAAILAGGEGEGNIGIGFAVPINTYKTLLPQLRKGQVRRGELGVQILSAPLTDDEAKQLGLPKAEGAIVNRVEPDSPAADAGLQAGDVIVEYNNQPVADSQHLTQMVVSTPGGTRVPVVYYRNGQKQTTTVTIREMQLENNGEGGGNGGGNGSAAPGFGLSLGNLTPDLAQQLGLPAGSSGAVVENVEPFTPAANSGIRRGDVILEVNRQKVHSAADAARALRSIQPGQMAFVLLSRGGVQMFLELRRE